MTDLSNTAQLIKKLTFPVILLLLFIAVIALIVFRITNKTTQEVYEPISIPSFKNVIKVSTEKYDISQLQLPEDPPRNAPLANQNIELGLLSQTNDLANRLGFIQPPTQNTDANLGDGFLFTNNTGTLHLFKNSLTYTNLTKDPKPDAINNLQSLQNDVNTLIDTIGFTNTLNQNPQVQYFKYIDEFIAETNSPQEANVVNLLFNHQLGNTKVIIPGKQIIASFDSNGSLIRFVYYPLEAQVDTNNYPLKSPQDALKGLVNGQGILAQVTTSNDYSPIPDTFNIVTLTSTYLAYYLPSYDQRTIIPVWAFDGVVEDKKEVFKVTYIVPAIISNLLKTSSEP